MKKIIALIIIIVLIVGGFIVFSLFNKENIEKETPSELEETEETEETVKEELTGEEEKQISLEALKSRLSIEARSFVGRYYSYSSDSGYYNLKNLLPLMSEQLTLVIKQKIDQGLPENGFFSHTFIPSTVSLKEFKEDTRAVFLVQGQEEVRDEQGRSLNQKEVEIVFILEKGTWKVDEINDQE